MPGCAPRIGAATPGACGDAIEVSLIQTKRSPPLSTVLNAEWFALS